MNFIYEKMTTEELWKEYILIKTKSIRDEIIARNMSFAENIARKKSKEFENILYPIEDAICSANIGLIEAFDRFDPHFSHSKSDGYLKRPVNDRFLGWSSLRISGEIVEGYRKSCWHNPKAAPAKNHSLVPVMFSSIESYSAYNEESGPFQPEDKNKEKEFNASSMDHEDFLNDYSDDCLELNSLQKTIVDLFYVRGLSKRAIGEYLNKTTPTIHGHKVEAVKKIQTLVRRRLSSERQRKLSSPKNHSTKGLVCH